MSGKRLTQDVADDICALNGFIGTVERIVTKPGPSSGFDLAVKNGIPQATFEQAVLDNPTLFSTAVIQAARRRLTSVDR